MTNMNVDKKRKAYNLSGMSSQPEPSSLPSQNTSNCLQECKQSNEKRRRMKRRCSKVGKMFDSNSLNFLSDLSCETEPTQQTQCSAQLSPQTQKRRRMNRRCSKVGRMFDSTFISSEFADNERESKGNCHLADPMIIKQMQENRLKQIFDDILLRTDIIRQLS